LEIIGPPSLLPNLLEPKRALYNPISVKNNANVSKEPPKFQQALSGLPLTRLGTPPKGLEFSSLIQMDY